MHYSFVVCLLLPFSVVMHLLLLQNADINPAIIQTIFEQLFHRILLETEVKVIRLICQVRNCLIRYHLFLFCACVRDRERFGLLRIAL